MPKWFCDRRVPEVFFPPEIIRMFGPKTVIFAPKYSFLGTYRPCRLIWCTVVWWLWCADCISHDTYLLYFNHFHKKMISPSSVISYCPHVGFKHLIVQELPSQDPLTQLSSLPSVTPSSDFSINQHCSAQIPEFSWCQIYWMYSNTVLKFACG